jgi:hypothetical protein
MKLTGIVSARQRQRGSKRVRVVPPAAKLYGATRRNALGGPPAAENVRARQVRAAPKTAASGHASPRGKAITGRGQR